MQGVAQIGAIAAATELFGWMTRHPENVLARALSKPGHELQHRFSTAEPTTEQLEVAEAALAACLELEEGAVTAAAKPPVKVKKTLRRYVITGTSSDAASGNVVAMNITQKKIPVVGDAEYTLPTSDNGGAFKAVVKKSKLPAGKYKLVFIDGSTPKFIKLAFKIP